jgi:hypothetical protein
MCLVCALARGLAVHAAPKTARENLCFAATPMLHSMLLIATTGSSWLLLLPSSSSSSSSSPLPLTLSLFSHRLRFAYFLAYSPLS